MSLRAGRDCPLDYRLPAGGFTGEPLFACDSLYVVGGLYGNRQALSALQTLLAAEPGARLVFNGDAHWFDRDPRIFAAIEQGLVGHLALRGNVETELARTEESGAGCGCAYPDSVAELTVVRSNAMLRELRQTLATLPGMARPLASRPATALIEVAGRRVAVSHGDEQSLAGWQCAREALRQPARQAQLGAWLAERGLSVLATSHTCAPAALRLGPAAVINNGAAGMPNHGGCRYGLVSRIANRPHPQALYRSTLDGLQVEALALEYDHAGFLADFDRLWPAGSPAALSYRDRVLHGPDDSLEASLLGGFRRCNPARISA